MASRIPERDRKMIGILVVILIIVLVPIGVYLELNLMTGIQTDNCVCFDPNQFAPGPPYQGNLQINQKLANMTAAANETGAIPSYAQVMKSNDTVIFHSMNISIPVFAYPNAVASGITNMSIPAYDNQSISNAFTVYGLYLPSLTIPRGATLNITFVNMDPTDHHNFVITTFPPPFAEYIMQNMATGGEMTAMTPLLPPIDNNTDTVSAFQYTVVLNLNVTHMWYMCMFPAHAQNGMWGNITLIK